MFTKPAAAGGQLMVRLIPGDGWRVAKQIVVVDAPKIEAAKLEFGERKDDDSILCLDVYVVGTGEPQRIATFRGVGEGAHSANLQANLQEAFENGAFNALRDQANSASGQAVGDAVQSPKHGQAPGGSGEPLGTEMHVPVPAAQKRTGWRRFLTVKRVALASVLLVGGGLVTVGLRANQAPTPFAATNGAEMDARVQAAISSSLRQPSNGDGLLQGQSVNLQTMRAMGLDPGKANTGCLVGVHK